MSMVETIQVRPWVDAGMSLNVCCLGKIGIFQREAEDNFNMEERMMLCNIFVESGDKCGFDPVQYLNDKTPVEYEPLFSNGNTRFFQAHSVDTSKWEHWTAKVLVSSANWSLPDGMGLGEAWIYLALPYIAAASALAAFQGL